MTEVKCDTCGAVVGNYYHGDGYRCPSCIWKQLTACRGEVERLQAGQDLLIKQYGSLLDGAEKCKAERDDAVTSLARRSEHPATCREEQDATLVVLKAKLERLKAVEAERDRLRETAQFALGHFHIDASGWCSCCHADADKCQPQGRIPPRWPNDNAGRCPRAALVAVLEPRP